MRGWQAFTLAVLAGVLGLALGNRVALIAALALSAVLLIGGVYRFFSVGDVRSTRQMGDDIVMWGDDYAQQVTLTNHSILPIPAIRVVDQTTLPEHPGGYVTSLKARRSVTWDIAVPCRQRGRYQVGPIEATMSDPLGLFPVTRRIGAAASILVLPRWVPLTRSALKLDGFLPGEARGRMRGESPPTVTSVRDYSAGDSMASIHWPASARTGQLMTKLFDPEVQTSLWLALDLDGDLPADVEELLVTAATSLGMYSLQQAKLRVGLIASGQIPAVLGCERGKPQQYRLQETLAEVHAGQAATLLTQFGPLQQRLGPGHAVVLLTASGPEKWGAWLARQARQGVAVRIVQVVAAEAAAVQWGLPTVTIPLALGDPAYQGELMQCLEGRARSAVTA